jgi:hypothetical protein
VRAGTREDEKGLEACHEWAHLWLLAFFLLAHPWDRQRDEGRIRKTKLENLDSVTVFEFEAGSCALEASNDIQEHNIKTHVYRKASMLNVVSSDVTNGRF